ncbi:MAG TPA: hypothetical protein VGV35_15145, partial [Bryobacteraceae bacterium]|nr:hypothetical protein [Bryobacteraceae bacterium]
MPTLREKIWRLWHRHSCLCGPRFFPILVCLSLFAQTPQAPPSTPPTFSTTTNLVILNVTVRDKSGKLVDNLKKEDFTVFEDEKPQSVAVFELERLSS